MKQSPSSELLAAVRAVAKGATYVDSAFARQSVQASERRRGRAASRPSISDRERDVLRMMAIGHSNKEIAASLDISVKTVEVHKANAMRKLGLRGRIDVVRTRFFTAGCASRSAVARLKPRAPSVSSLG